MKRPRYLRPKTPICCIFLYQSAINKGISNFNNRQVSKPLKGEPQTPSNEPLTAPFAPALEYLHQAQNRDRANAWPLYEEAALLFRLAPYSIVGPSGNRDATPKEKQAALDAVQNKEARQRGKQAIDQMVQGNGLPRYDVPRYEDSVPRLLEQAWNLNIIRFLGENVFNGMSRQRELARSAMGYAQVMTQPENNVGEAVRANRATVGMGYRMVGDWSIDENFKTGKTIISVLVGIAICAIGYKGLVQTYETVGDKAGANAAQTESDAFQVRVSDYKKAMTAKIINASIYEMY